MPLDCFVISGITAQLNERLCGARIDKIHMPRKDRIVLSVRGNGGAHKLMIAGGHTARMHLTDERHDNPDEPPMLCMLLRKHMAGGRIISITQPIGERMIEIAFTGADELGDISEKRLVCEFMGRSNNVILVDSGGTITACMRRTSLEDGGRIVAPGMLYKMPPNGGDRLSVFTASEQEILEAISGFDGNLTDHLSGISPAIARDCAARSEGDTARLACLLFELRSRTPQPLMLMQDGKATDFSAFPILGKPHVLCDGFSEMLDDFYRERERDESKKAASGALLRTIKNIKSRLERRLAGQRQELITAQGRESIKRHADLIMANLHAIEHGVCKAEVVDYYSEQLPTVTIELDPELTPQQNAQLLFKRYERRKNAEIALTERIAIGEQELAYVESLLYSLDEAQGTAQIAELKRELESAGYIRKSGSKKRDKPSAFAPRAFERDGFTLLIGRNNRENAELTHKHASKSDLWFHAREIAGSHAVLLTEGRSPSDSIVEWAAKAAAYYSSGKNMPRVAVDYTTIKNVKRQSGAQPGMVHYFNFTTVLVEPTAP